MKTSGTVIITDVDGVTTEQDTVNCVHCQHVWPRKAAEKLGWCMRCMGPTCATARCGEKCVPFMKAIEQTERRNELRRKLTE